MEKAFDVVGDKRNRLLRWWHRNTIASDPNDGHFLIESRIRFSLLDRVLIALGRDVKVVYRSSVELDPKNEHMHEVFAGIQSHSTTNPRSWRRS